MTDFLKIAKSIVVHFAHICAYGVETVNLLITSIFHLGTSCLRIQFSTKIVSPRRGCGRVGVASGPGNFSWDVGNYVPMSQYP